MKEISYGPYDRFLERSVEKAGSAIEANVDNVNNRIFYIAGIVICAGIMGYCIWRGTRGN